MVPSSRSAAILDEHLIGVIDCFSQIFAFGWLGYLQGQKAVRGGLYPVIAPGIPGPATGSFKSIGSFEKGHHRAREERIEKLPAMPEEKVESSVHAFGNFLLLLGLFPLREDAQRQNSKRRRPIRLIDIRRGRPAAISFLRAQ